MALEVTAGVATATAADTAPVADIADEDTPLAPGEEVAEIADEEVPLNVVEDTEVMSIEDEDTPLAGNEQGTKRVWWWWILVIIAAITGKSVYDKKNKNGIFPDPQAAGNTEDTKDDEK